MRNPDFKVLFEAAAGRYVVFDRELRIVAASDAYVRATRTTREALLGQRLSDVLPDNPDDPRSVGVRTARRSLERVIREGVVDTVAGGRYDIALPQGGFEERYWNVVSAPVPAADGSVEYVLSSLEEVTPPQLRTSEQRLRKVLEVDAISVLFWDADGRLLWANDTFLRWGGYTGADVAAGDLTWQRLTPAEWHEASRGQLARLASTGRIGPYEKEYFRRDGTRCWMLFVGGDLGDGTFVEYALDIGGRKQAEQRLRDSEERYRSLFESIDAGFCIIEMIYDRLGQPADYRFLEVNPAFERQTGLKDATRKTMREHVPEHEQHWFDTYARVAETGEPLRFVNAAKALMGGWYEVHAFRVGGPQSRRVAILFNDITERVRGVESLKEADRRKDEFLATLAHEPRNPLAPIRNAVSILRLRGAQDPDVAGARDLIDRQVDYLVRLVDDLLDISRITFGKVELRRAPLDLRAVVEEALATSRPLLDEAQHRLALRLPREPLWVDGDRVRLAQVISNLVNNAARYTGREGEVTICAQEAGSEAVVSIEDNGIGIAPEMLGRIFEPFVQVDPRDAASAGLGIGLSLAKMLVERHGGALEAHSEGLGRGSRFVVRLPRTDAAAPAAELPAAAPEVRRRFLIVDDNVDAASSQAELLRLCGHEAETAFNGREALEKAARFRPDVVLLDLGMPEMDGFEVARRLRQTPEGRDATVIAQTGWGQEEDRRRTAAAGFDAHLAKPVAMRTLMEALGRVSAAR